MNRSKGPNVSGNMGGINVNNRGGRKGGRGGFTQQSFRSRTPNRNRNQTPIQNRSRTPMSRTPVQNRSQTPSRNRSQTPSRNNNSLIQRRNVGGNLFRNGPYGGSWQQRQQQQRQGQFIRRPGMRYDNATIQSRLNTMHRQMMLARSRVRRAQQVLNVRTQSAQYPRNLQRGYQRIVPGMQRARTWPSVRRNPIFGAFRSDGMQAMRNNRAQPLMGQGGPDNLLTISITNERAGKSGRRNPMALRGTRMGRMNGGRAIMQQRRTNPNVGYLNRQSIARLNTSTGGIATTLSPNGSVITTVSQKSSLPRRRSRSVSRRRQHQQRRSQSAASERRSDFLNLDLQKEIAAIQRKTFSVPDIVYPQPIENHIVDGLRFRPTATSTRVTLNERFSQ